MVSVVTGGVVNPETHPEVPLLPQAYDRSLGRCAPSLPARDNGQTTACLPGQVLSLQQKPKAWEKGQLSQNGVSV